MTDDELWQDIEERRQATLARRAGIEFESTADPGAVRSAGLPPRWDDTPRRRPVQRVRRRPRPRRGK